MSEEEKIEVRKYVWGYFEFHGNQRITLIRYYIIFVTLYLTGAALLVRGFHCSGVSYKIYAVMTSLAFVFATWNFQCLDKRNEDFINNARKALIALEKNATDKVFKVFSNEKRDDPNRHSVCFKRFFTCGYVLAAVIIIWSAHQFCTATDDCGTEQIKVTEPIKVMILNGSDEGKSLQGSHKGSLL